jgi:hypothetical protein
MNGTSFQSVEVPRVWGGQHSMANASEIIAPLQMT